MNCIELKCARVRRGKSSSHMARTIGLSLESWSKRERGEVRFSLNEVLPISMELDLSEREFCDIFFDGKLPFRRNEHISSTVDIVTEGSETINGQTGD